MQIFEFLFIQQHQITFKLKQKTLLYVLQTCSSTNLWSVSWSHEPSRIESSLWHTVRSSDVVVMAGFSAKVNSATKQRNREWKLPTEGYRKNLSGCTYQKWKPIFAFKVNAIKNKIYFKTRLKKVSRWRFHIPHHTSRLLCVGVSTVCVRTPIKETYWCTNSWACWQNDTS